MEEVGKAKLLLNLLLGLLIPNQGLITVDNKDIKSSLKDWQKIISYIPQNVFITDDKIINNIALGVKEGYRLSQD